MSDEHIEETDPVDPAALEECARTCAQGWANEANAYSPRTWNSNNSAPDADVYFFEQQIGRPMTASEAGEFSQIFRDEYDAVMEMRAVLGGWDD